MLYTTRVQGNFGQGYEQPANRHRLQQQTGGEWHAEQKKLEITYYSGRGNLVWPKAWAAELMKET